MIRDVAAMNASLDNDYGTTRGPNSPAAHGLALYNGDPALGGVEISGGGYARASVPASAWAPAANGAKTTSGVLAFPEPTGAWSATATHWGLLDGSGTMWDYAPLATPITVTGPGSSTPGYGPAVTVTVYYDDVLNTE